MRENNAILLTHWRTYDVFFFHNKIKFYTFFLSCLSPFSKIQKGSRSNICNFMGYLILKKTIFKVFLTNSPGANLAYLALLCNFSWVPFFLLGPLNAKQSCPENKPVWAMRKCMVSIATNNRFKNGVVPTKITHILAATLLDCLTSYHIKA